MALDPTPTVRGVIDGLTTRPVVVRDVVQALVKRHPEYGTPDPLDSFGVPWPEDPRTWEEAEDLERDVDALFPDTVPGGELHGRLLLLGAGLVDLESGRAMCRAGMFQAVARDLDPPLPDVLTAEGRARLRTIPLATVETTPAVVLDHDATVTGLALGEDGHRVVTVDVDGRVSVWNRRARRRVAALDEDSPTTWTGFVGAGVDDGRLQLVDARARRRLRLTADRVVDVARDEHEAVVEGPTTVTAAPATGRLAWLGADGTVAVADPGDGEPRRVGLTRAGSPVQPSAIALAPSGEVLVAAEPSGPVGLFSTTTGALVEELTGVPSGVATAVAVDGQGGIVVAQDGSLAHRPPPALGLPSSTMPTTFGHDLSGATSLVPSPTDAMVAGISTRGEVLLVETGEQRVLARLPVSGHVSALSYSGDGHWLAVAAGTAVHLFAVGTRPTPLPPAPPLYAADDPDARTDLLDLDDEVRAFASLVAAVDVVPPLAIGVFGDWGSGKTFFIRRLRREVAELSADARASDAPQGRLGFYKHVVQVEFNAWHYAEGDLLASLVTHLFSNLEQFGDEAPGEIARRRDWVLAQLREERARQERLEAEVGGLASEEDRLADELDAQRVRHGDEVRLLASEHERLASERGRIATANRAAVQKAVGAVGIAMPPLGAGLEQLRAALAAADEEARHGGGVLRRPSGVSRGRWVARSAVGAVLLAGLALLVGWLLSGGGAVAVVGVLTTVGALASGAAALIDRTTKEAADHRAVIAAVRGEIEEQEAALRERHAAERTAIEARLTATRERIERLEATRDERHRRETELRRTLAAITPSRVLADYVVERAGSDDYRSLLGVHSLVQRDFRTLADLVDRSNRDELRDRADAGDDVPGGSGDAEQRRINRIVLYIDDLDRCPPAVVVSVLEAVHLLLAFPLFVVVVAVDPRWVAHALETTYPELLLRVGGDATRPKATAYDYLEKIFQVPFWVRSVPTDGVGSFVAGLTGGAARPVDDTGPPDEVADEQGDTSDGTAAASPGGSAVGGGTQSRQAASASTEAPDLSPERLRLSAEELATLERVAPLLGRSPRRIKRFVNVYRLIRATEDDPDFATARDGQLSASQAVATLLAIITGMPDSAPGLFELLRGADDARSSAAGPRAGSSQAARPGQVGDPDADGAVAGPTLADLVRGIRPLDCRPEDWHALATFLGLRGGAPAPWPLPLASLRPWLETVTRYSFAVPLGG